MSGSKEQTTSMAMSQTMNGAGGAGGNPVGTSPRCSSCRNIRRCPYGDPTKDGLFSMRFKLPKGYHVPPHTLSKAGTFTVMSGTFRIGMGENVDPTKLRASRRAASSRFRAAPCTSCPWTRRRWFSSTISGLGYLPISIRRTTRARSQSNWRINTWWPGTA